MKLKTRFCAASAALFASLSLLPCAHAEPNASLSEVQKAYADVDYERTRSLSAAALERGKNDHASTGELYLLWATAAAAVDHADEARTAFSYAIAANPELKLDRNLSPKIRAPYLEARGAMSSTDGRPALEVTLRRHKQELELELHDVLHVAASLLVSTRALDGAAFVRRRFDAAPTRRLPTPQGSELQFVVQVRDRYDNVLFELGSEDEPQRLVQVTSSRSGPAEPARTGSASAVPYYITSGALGLLGVAAGGFASVMYLRREDAARDWNGPACERPGVTRAEQCGPVDERRKRAQYLSVGFAAAGGALLVGGVISLVLAPSSSRADVALDAGPGNLMLRLRTTL
jgi:hypothetical protein